MAFIRWVFLSIIGILLIFVALANRDPVVLRLFPAEFSVFLPVPPPIEVPMFLVMFGFIVLGLLIGFVWEWMRERRHRQQAVIQKRQVVKLEREVDGLKRQKAGDKDDILALLD